MFFVLRFVGICLLVVLLFNFLILVHELGHYLAARWRGMVIEKFAIWFGKPIWKKKINGIEYSLGSIPAGGFVALPQMAPMEALEGKNELKREELPPVSPIDKIIVAFAGPLFSFGLAFALALIVWVVGRPVSEADTTTTIGYVLPDSKAEKAGLQVGDKIISIDGHAVTRFSGVGDSIIWRVLSSEGSTIDFEVSRDGVTKMISVQPDKHESKFWQRKALRQVGIEGAQSSIVSAVSPNSPAAQADIRPGDEILAVDGQKLYSMGNLISYIDKVGSVPMTLTVSRDGREFPVKLTPRAPIQPTDMAEPIKPKLGVTWEYGGRMKVIYPTPYEQLHSSIATMVNTLAAVISPKSDIKPEHLNGPLGIMRAYYLLFASEQGWRMVLWFSVLLNVNLALVNLLPLPVLDGGHILLALIEMVRRRPINARVLETLTTACALLIIGYMLYISFYDVQDYAAPGGGGHAPSEIKFAPPS